MLLLQMTFAAVLAQSAPARLEQNEGRVLKTRFTLTVTVPPSNNGEETDLWIPVPSRGPFQEVAEIRVSGINKWSLNSEPKYGNAMVYAQTTGRAEVKATVTYVVEREQATETAGFNGDHGHAEYLGSDSLVPVGGKYAKIADEAIAFDGDGVTAIFRHVVANMQYDYNKESPKLGMGDVAFVCDYKKGNCSDLHSYLISLLRSIGVPSYLEYGFPISGIPVGDAVPKSGSINGYHCWTWYYDSGKWRPLDASDSRRWLDAGYKAQSEFLKGNLVLERSAVAVSKGRDIVLSPPQKGRPRNNFVYPYAERGGIEIEVKWEMSYERLD